MYHIRPIAICVFRRDNRILVSEGYDPVKNETFYRPLGGMIEFGEHSAQTVHREIREEIGAEVADLRYLGTLENIFVYDGWPGHEIVMVYDGTLKDGSLYRRDRIEVAETGSEETTMAVWKDLREFAPDRPPLYPHGLLELLA